MPLNILEMDIVPNPKSTLWSARNLTAKDPLNGIRNNLYKNTMSLFLSEVLLRAVKDGQAEDGLYPWCVRSILTLDSLDSDFSNFHIRFLLEFAGALGFSPTFEDIAPFAEKHLAQLKPFLTGAKSATPCAKTFSATWNTTRNPASTSGPSPSCAKCSRNATASPGSGQRRPSNYPQSDKPPRWPQARRSGTRSPDRTSQTRRSEA